MNNQHFHKQHIHEVTSMAFQKCSKWLPRKFKFCLFNKITANLEAKVKASLKHEGMNFKVKQRILKEPN